MRRIRIIAMQLYNILLNNYIYCRKIYCRKIYMIQRIQTLYIIIGTISIVFAFFKIPFFHCIDDVNSLYILNNYYSVCFFLLLVILTVFSFQNRKRQIKLIYFLSFFCSIIILWTLYNYFNGVSSGAYSVSNSCGFNVIILPFFLAGKILYYLSIKAIMRDNELLDSINRLR
ncbi:MAG: hypothetical protein CMD27_04195 [Flavobacteriales bacterium]|nr:hypothetical protein [Flavobacteriales bacterium]